MYRALTLFALLTIGTTAGAQNMEIIASVDGVRRSSGADLERGNIYDPEFDTGGGLGLGVNWYFTDRLSLEGKVSALTSRSRLRVVLPDFIATVELERANIYPVMATLQWHPFADGGTFRPYIGVGAAYVIVQGIAGTELTPEIDFNNPTGLLVNGGVRFRLSDQWDLLGDARWVPIETQARARFGEDPEVDLDVRPLIVGFGVAYRF